MNLRLTYEDYTMMLRQLDEDIREILLRIKAANVCITGDNPVADQVLACEMAGEYYRKRLTQLIKAKLHIAIERAMLNNKGA